MLKTFKQVLQDPVLFAQAASGLRLRGYQIPVARAIVRSALENQGLSLAVMFPRQSGKNELQAQLEAYLLTLFSQSAGEVGMVKISPTWKPQSQNAMRRLESVLKRNLFTRNCWSKESGYIYRVGQARLTFLSGAPESHIVGATASLLLEVDEAQDILPEKYDREIAPMAASTHATRIFWGTAWTPDTLLGRELRAAARAEEADGQQRVFRVDADAVAAEVPAYGRFVAEQVQKLGRFHPMIRTQFYSEEIEADGALFPPARMALLQGTHAPLDLSRPPEPGRMFALLVDVAGQDEQPLHPGLSQTAEEEKRDCTAITLVELVFAPATGSPAAARPVYRVAAREQFRGVSHAFLLQHLLQLTRRFQVLRLVADATGVGAGLCSMLQDALGEQVQPFIFSAVSKSELGWGFLHLIDSGRFQEYSPPETASGYSETNQALELHDLFLRQISRVQYEVAPGPEKRIRWSVPDGTRDAASGRLLHDDLVISAALTAALEKLHYAMPAAPAVIRAADPLRELDRGF